MTQRPRPRDWLEHPASFGRDERAEWLSAEPGTLEFVLRRAACVQHAVVCLMRGRIGYEQRKWVKVAERSTLNYDALMEIVRGEQHMRLTDIIDLTAQFGPLLIASQQLRQSAGFPPETWPGLPPETTA